MSNTINWGKIYLTTWWGVGVSTNTISWGKSYSDLGFNFVANNFRERVIADGGTVEALGCVSSAGENWNYNYRVTNDGGTVESLGCVEFRNII